MAKRSDASENKKTTTTDINAVSLIGTVLRPHQYEKMCRFTLVCGSETPAGKIANSYIPVVWFNEGSEETVAEDERVAVNGRLKSGQYEKDGRTIYTLDVVAEEVKFS